MQWLKKKHPALFQLVRELQKEQNDTEVKVAELQAGKKSQPTKEENLRPNQSTVEYGSVSLPSGQRRHRLSTRNWSKFKYLNLKKSSF